jgi:hypothetical protein
MELAQFFTDYKTWQTAISFYSNETAADIDWMQQLPSFWYTDVENINACASNVIIINCFTEGVHSADCFNLYNKDKTYIIFTNDIWDTKQSACSLPNYHNVYYPTFLFDTVDNWFSSHRLPFYLDKLYEFGDKPMLFVSTIGSKKNHRTVLVDHLTENIKYKNYILRYAGKDFAQPSNHLDLHYVVNNKFDAYSNIIDEHFHTISDSIPIDLWNSAYVNFIVETDFDFSGNWFLTEKTIKSLLSGQPFVVLSNTWFLRGLRALGFRTYNTLWDENYDAIGNTQQRIDAIIYLLNSFDHFDWQAKQHELESIANHNARNLLRLNNLGNKVFRDFENLANQLRAQI